MSSPRTMMDPSMILAAFVTERQRRGSVPSLAGKLAEAHGSDRSHAEERWVELCQLTTGVPSLSLDVIGLFVMASKGTQMQPRLLDPSEATSLPQWSTPDTTSVSSSIVLWELRAKPVTARDVARMLNDARGLNLTAPQVKALRQEAIERVTDNQIRRGR